MTDKPGVGDYIESRSKTDSNSLPVKVGISRPLDVKISLADVIDGFIVHLGKQNSSSALTYNLSLHGQLRQIFSSSPRSKNSVVNHNLSINKSVKPKGCDEYPKRVFTMNAQSECSRVV